MAARLLGDRLLGGRGGVPHRDHLLDELAVGVHQLAGEIVVAGDGVGGGDDGLDVGGREVQIVDPVGDLGVGFDELGLEIRETFEETVFDFGELLGDVHGACPLCSM